VQGPPPTHYTVENYTINMATKVIKEEDEDLVAEKAPFNTSVVRFSEEKKNKCSYIVHNFRGR
jgi:hypothetical protein